MITQLYHDLVKNLISILAQVQNYPNSSKCLTTPIQHYGIEAFPYQEHGEEVEEKTRS
jgi:hypothetical protein